MPRSGPTPGRHLDEGDPLVLEAASTFDTDCQTLINDDKPCSWQGLCHSGQNLPARNSHIDYLSAVPEPSTALLFGSSLLGLIAIARRRRPLHTVHSCGMPHSEIAVHARWKYYLRQAIESGTGDWDAASVHTDDRCDFGAWLYSPSKSNRDSKRWDTIRTLHAEFHLLGC